MPANIPAANAPAAEHLLALYRMMARIRAFENAAEEASRGGVAVFGAAADTSALVRGQLHLTPGQEAVAAGVCAHLALGDYLTSTHRGHGHLVAKGGSIAARASPGRTSRSRSALRSRSPRPRTRPRSWPRSAAL